MGNKTIQVGALDDHSTVIDGYKFKLQGHQDIQIAWSAEYYSEVEPWLEKHPTDCLLLDASVDNSPNDPNTYPILHIIPKLLDLYPDLAILVISMHNRKAFIRNVMQAGASGYIIKDDNETYQQLPEVIRNITAGEIYYPQIIANHPDDNPQNTPILTPRQLEVLSLKAGSPEISTKDIADYLHIAASSVRNLLSTTYTRLGVRNISSAIEKAKKLGLITPDK